MIAPEIFHDGRVHLYGGDSREVLRQIPDASIDAVVCDPPYGLGKEPDPAEMLRAWLAGEEYAASGAGLMGKAWDAFVPGPAIWRECLRVLKPGGHLLAFFSTRTHDLGTLAIRLAGFQIRDTIWDVIASDTHVQGFLASLDHAQRAAFARCIDEAQFGGALAWLYASGFPKSHDVARAIDALDAVEMRRERALQFTSWMRSTGISSAVINRLTDSNMASHYLTAGTQPEVATAEMFDLLRPALPPVPGEIEEMVRARTVESENLKRRRVVGHHEEQAHAAKWREAYDGSAAAEAKPITEAYSEAAKQWEGWGTALKPGLEPITLARKPLIGSIGENVRAHGVGALNIAGCQLPGDAEESARWPANLVHDGSPEVVAAFPAEGGASASRFFFSGKAGGEERVGTKHPTVKRRDLCQWLVRMVCPPGGTVLDPFAGSGTTGEAAFREGMRAILVEREPEYRVDIARRMTLTLAGPATRRAEGAKARARAAAPAPLFGED